MQHTRSESRNLLVQKLNYLRKEAELVIQGSWRSESCYRSSTITQTAPPVSDSRTTTSPLGFGVFGFNTPN